MKQFLGVLLVAAGLLAGSAQAGTALVPLLETDIQPGCGCSFTRFNTREAPIVRWSSEGKKKAQLRAEGKVQTLDLRQEKYIPERDGGPRPSDRFVLHVSNGDWNVQAVMNAVGAACKGKGKTCSLTRYEGRLVVLEGGRQRSEIPAVGICGCE
ncbi:hypothetical protein [Viridibacterium curvum]|uniref:Secreted protein n=1 Tax=Viridibacterium curvum TaxID=1101404 RepID=A0ABP9R0C5_9RHOO